MLTKFGEEIRIMRIRKKETLGGMAKGIGVSSAFLSKVENGFAKPSEKVVEGIITYYKLSEKEAQRLRELAENERKYGSIVDFRKYSQQDGELLYKFAQAIDKLSDEEKQDISKIIQRK